MEFLEQIVRVIYKRSTISKVKELFKSSRTRDHYEEYNINFRIIKTNTKTINLEFFCSNGIQQYYKPVCFFELEKKGLLQSDKIHFTILKEFEFNFDAIKSSLKKSHRDNTKFLTIKENAFIGACSIETSTLVGSMFNSPEYSKFALMSGNIQSQNIVSNGLNLNIRSSMMGALEVNLNDDDFELEDSLLVMYQNNGGLSIHSNDEVYHRLTNLKLLSALNDNENKEERKITPKQNNTNYDNLTFCKIEAINYRFGFYFTHLKIDITPQTLIDSGSMNKLFQEAHPYRFYVFKELYNSNLDIGTEMNLDLEKFDHFSKNGIQVFYHREQFNEVDISILEDFQYD